MREAIAWEVVRKPKFLRLPFRALPPARPAPGYIRRGCVFGFRLMQILYRSVVTLE